MEQSNEILDDFGSEESSLREEDLLKTIWIQPAETFRFILKKCPHKYVNHLVIATVVLNGVEKAVTTGKFNSIELIGSALGQILGTAFLGLVVLAVYTFILWIIGKLLGGIAEFQQTWTVLLWSGLPVIAGAVLIPIKLILFSRFSASLFEQIEGDSFGLYLYNGLSLIDFGLAIWSLIILVQGIKVSERFSLARSIATLVIPFFVIAFLALAFFIMAGDLDDLLRLLS